VTQWVYETADSEEPERPVCRSIDIQKMIVAQEQELKNAMDTN